MTGPRSLWDWVLANNSSQFWKHWSVGWGLGKSSAFLVLEQRKNNYILQAFSFISWPFSLLPAWNRQVLPRLWGSKHRDKEGEAERQEEPEFLMVLGAATSDPVLTICQLQIKFKIKQNTGKIHKVQIIWNQTHFKVIKYIKTLWLKAYLMQKEV